MSSIHLISGGFASGKSSILQEISNRMDAHVVDFDDHIDWEYISTMLNDSEESGKQVCEYIKNLLYKQIDVGVSKSDTIVISGEFTIQDIVTSCIIPKTKLQGTYNKVYESCILLPMDCSKHYIVQSYDNMINGILNDYVKPAQPERFEIEFGDCRLSESQNHIISQYLNDDSTCQFKGPWNEHTWTIEKYQDGIVSNVEWIRSTLKSLSAHRRTYESLNFVPGKYDEIIQKICS